MCGLEKMCVTLLRDPCLMFPRGHSPKDTEFLTKGCLEGALSLNFQLTPPKS